TPDVRLLIGGCFMFRGIMYAIDMRKEKGRPSLREFLRYFFLLPNYCIAFFPMIDFVGMRKRYMKGDLNAIAQQGIYWIWRGTLQIALAQFVFEPWRELLLPINSLPRLFLQVVLQVGLFCWISGAFHLSIGILHLFGHDLPPA